MLSDNSIIEVVNPVYTYVPLLIYSSIFSITHLGETLKEMKKLQEQIKQKQFEEYEARNK